MAGQTAAQAYAFLKQRFAEISNLNGASSILHADADTVMRKASGKDRANQLVALATVMHEKISDPRVEEALDIAETKIRTMNANHRRNLALMRRQWIHQAGLPLNLAQEKARIESEGQQLHTQYRKTGDWKIMGPHYERSFRAAKEIGEATMTGLGAPTAHDALIDRFSPGLTSAIINPRFAQLRAVLPGMIQERLERQAAMPDPIEPKGSFSDEKQGKINREMAKVFGFDFRRGVHSSIQGHPSCGGTPDDVRITTRLNKHDVVPGLYGTIHETGHANYESNLPKSWRYQPAGSALGMDIHETQSMIMEYQAAMTPEFMEFLARRLQDEFNYHGDPAFSAYNLQRMMWNVKASFIRVEADEMTYPLHVVLRYELEKNIFNGSLNSKDLPEAWAKGMKDLLGITPANNTQGCMQDVHWPVLLQGYFPAYAFGAMGAAQFMKAAQKDRPDIMQRLRVGDTSPLRAWLKTNVHEKGSLVASQDLFIQATGEPLNTSIYLDHLSRRYLDRPYIV